VIPIRDINPTSTTAWVTLALITANVAVFLLWEPTFAGQAEQQEFFFCNAQIPFELTHQTSSPTGERRR
jgi:membrane associated rhomboid family serine protease